MSGSYVQDDAGQTRTEMTLHWLKTKLCNQKLKINRKKIQFNKSIFRKPPSGRLKTTAEQAQKGYHKTELHDTSHFKLRN